MGGGGGGSAGLCGPLYFSIKMKVLHFQPASSQMLLCSIFGSSFCRATQHNFFVTTSDYGHIISRALVHRRVHNVVLIHILDENVNREDSVDVWLQMDFHTHPGNLTKAHIIPVNKLNVFTQSYTQSVPVLYIL